MTVGLAFRYINLAEGGKSLAEVELRKPRNLFVYVSEEREDAERAGMRSRKRHCAHV